MKIELLTESDIAGWHSFFGYFCDTSFLKLWEIIGVPEVFVSDPIGLTEFSKTFLEEKTEIVDTGWCNSLVLNDRLEFIRLLHLSYLCQIFAKLTLCYGETNSTTLYDLAERNFTHKKSTFWWEWFYFMHNEVKGDPELATILAETELRKLFLLIEDDFLSLEHRIKSANIEFSRLKKRENGERFSLILQQEQAFQTWRKINARLSIDSRKQLFSWGAKISRRKRSSINWRDLRRYCLSV